MAITESMISNLLTLLTQQPDGPAGGGMYYIDDEEILEIKNQKGKPIEPDYCRTWYKLNKTQKINRLIIYAQKLTKEYGLSTDQQIHVKQLFMKIFNMDNNADVEYDSATGQILKIKNLQRSMDGKNEFYISTTTSMNAVCNTPEFSMTPLTLTELMSAVNTPVVKKKILIRKKTPAGASPP